MSDFHDIAVAEAAFISVGGYVRTDMPDVSINIAGNGPGTFCVSLHLSASEARRVAAALVNAARASESADLTEAVQS